MQNIDTHIATPKSLDFHSEFSLVAESDTTMRAFLTYFDTFFSPTRSPCSEVDLSIMPTGPVQPVTPGVVSFTTGPRGKETHWRQVAFLLHTPIEVKKGKSPMYPLTSGDIISGTFYCRKSSNNSRELDVEIHYFTVGDVRVQTFKVR
jgi:protein arginine N-methyltransferase 3